MAYEDFNQKEIYPGDEQRVANHVETIGATSVTAAFPQKRRVLYLRNSSAGGQIITVSLGSTVAIANSGIILNPGEYYIEATSDEFDAYSGSVQAIANGAGGKLTVMER